MIVRPTANELLPYGGRRVSLATCHGKERALARPFRRGLGLTVVVATGFDTDQLGTFSGERSRPADAGQTCRQKAEAGRDHTGLDLGLASEGRFGPHPSFPWLAVNLEWLTFVDRRAGLVIADNLLADRTNFNHRVVAPGEDIEDWLRRVGFPSHALIVRPHRWDASGEAPVIKGVRTARALAEALDRCVGASCDGRARLETDMRAHCNPTRLGVIRTLAFRLVRRIARRCPACAAPGGHVGLRGLRSPGGAAPAGWQAHGRSRRPSALQPLRGSGRGHYRLGCPVDAVPPEGTPTFDVSWKPLPVRPSSGAAPVFSGPPCAP